MAVTEAIKIGNRDAMVRSTISISKVNTSPAIGALKIPETAAVAPQPTNSISVRRSILKILPRLLPMAEPVSTIGASAPTDPPKPIVIADATMEVHVLCAFSLERFVEIAYNTRVIPCEIWSRTTYLTNKLVSQIPITG